MVSGLCKPASCSFRPTVPVKVAPLNDMKPCYLYTYFTITTFLSLRIIKKMSDPLHYQASGAQSETNIATFLPFPHTVLLEVLSSTKDIYIYSTHRANDTNEQNTRIVSDSIVPQTWLVLRKVYGHGPWVHSAPGRAILCQAVLG